MAAGVLFAQAAMACDAPPDPVGSLAYGSRYAEDSETRSDIDAAGEAAAEDALRPIDDFLRDLTERANDVLKGEDSQAQADCIVSQVAGHASGQPAYDTGR
jgi:poly(beta-D-mannuronate) lyase